MSRQILSRRLIIRDDVLHSQSIAFSESVTKAASSAKSMSRTRTVLTLVLVRRRARLKSLPSVEESSEWDKRREDSKDCPG